MMPPGMPPGCSDRPAPRSISRVLWRGAGYIFFGIGGIGAFLPVLPTTGPWILAVWCLIKGEDPLAHRLLQHRRFGRPLREWVHHGRISRRGKIFASCGMSAGWGLATIAGAPTSVLIGLAVTLLGVMGWLWSRPRSQMGT